MLLIVKITLFCLFSLCGTLFCHAQSETIFVDDSEVVANFCEGAQILEDPLGNYTIEYISSNSGDALFQSFEAPNLKFKNTSYYWIKLVINNVGNEKCFLKVDQPIVECIEFYSRNHQSWVKIKSGYSIPIAERQIQMPHPFFTIDKGVGVYYIRVKANHLAVPLILIPNKLFAKSSFQHSMGVGIIIGILLLTLLYYSVLGFKFKSFEFYSYCLTVLGYIAGALWLEGYGLYFSNEKYFESQNFISSLAIVFLGWFGFLFLEIKKCPPVIRYVYQSIIVTYGIMAIVSLFGLYGSTVFILWQILFSTLLIFNIIYGFVRYRQTDNKVFIAYSSAYLFFLAFGILELFHLDRGLPHYLPVLYVSLGYVSESIMLGYALIMKFEFAFENERAAKEQAVLENLKLTEKLNRDLELTVQNRTAELQERTELLKIQNDKLLALDEEKNRMIHIVSHDLKSPINNILGLAKIIKLEKNGSANVYIDTIIQAAERLKSMVVSILDLETLEQGAVNPKLETLNVSILLKDVCDEFMQQAIDKEINIETIWGRREFFVKADRQYLFQVISNLFSNALKFSTRKSTVTIEISARGELTIISVSDQGPGISEADMPRLFNKFQKLTARPTNGESSTGLGLAIAKELVEKMGGRISCASKVGVGSTFAIELA